MRRFRNWLTCLAAAALCACSSLQVEMNQALKADGGAGEAHLARTGPFISEEGYRLFNLADNGAAPDMLVFLALSGGGKRSAAYSYGVLQGLREIPFEIGGTGARLLDEVDMISAVSGGSFTAMYYGLHREETFERFANDFLYEDIESYIYGIYLLPWNWDWLFNPVVGTNDYMRKVYDDLMFHDARYADLIPKGRPYIVLGATDIGWGTAFSFSQDQFDTLCSDLSAFPVARAVAASNGFPVLFTPVTLQNHRRQCGDRLPAWYARLPESVRRNPLSRRGFLARSADHYLDPDATSYVHLMDGGIVDNLAMRGLLGNIILISDSIEAYSGLRLEKIRRVLLVSADGQATQDSSWAKNRTVSGIGQLLSNVSGTQIDQYNFETLVLARDQMARLVETLRRVRCSRGPTVDGRPCGDVAGLFVHLALSTEQGADADRLKAIPTGLTIPAADVDLLVAAGRNAVLRSQVIRAFLDDYGTDASLAPAAPARIAPGT